MHARALIVRATVGAAITLDFVRAVGVEERPGESKRGANWLRNLPSKVVGIQSNSVCRGYTQIISLSNAYRKCDDARTDADTYSTVPRQIAPQAQSPTACCFAIQAFLKAAKGKELLACSSWYTLVWPRTHLRSTAIRPTSEGIGPIKLLEDRSRLPAPNKIKSARY
jgi:hypothetical protein